MSLNSLLNHTCDIYHIVESDSTPGYGLPSSKAYTYPDEADISAQTCHFGVKSQSVTITQQAPENVMDARIKLTLPLGVDVRLNDKIINCDTGYQYTAELPMNVRDHHLFVWIKRIEEQKPL